MSESRRTGPIEFSTLVCPNCGRGKAERMPVDACRFFYKCDACSSLLKPLPGDCCVFCSYGTVPCPPVQSQGRCCRPKQR